MAIGHTLLDSGEGINTDITSKDTASVSPAGDALLLAVVHGTGYSVDNNVVPICDNSDLDWVEVASIVSVNQWGRLTVFRAMGASPSSGAITFSWSQGQHHVQWAIHEFSGVDTGGTNGSAAVVQAEPDNDTNTNNLTVTLAAFGDVLNATFGAFGTMAPNPNAYTYSPGSGFSELTDLPTLDSGNGYSSGLQTEWLNGNDTSVDSSTTKTQDAYAGIAIEIKAAVVGVTGKSNPLYGPLGGPMMGPIG